MSEAHSYLLVAAMALRRPGFPSSHCRTAAIPVSSPERLVAELRLAQIAALLLTLVAGAYLGLAAAQEGRTGVGLDIALAVGFFVLCRLHADLRSAPGADAAGAGLRRARHPRHRASSGGAARRARAALVHGRAAPRTTCSSARSATSPSCDAVETPMTRRIARSAACHRSSPSSAARPLRAARRVTAGRGGAPLVVVLVVDQMRSRVPGNYGAQFHRRLKRLIWTGARGSGAPPIPT